MVTVDILGAVPFILWLPGLQAHVNRKIIDCLREKEAGDSQYAKVFLMAEFSYPGLFPNIYYINIAP